MVLKSMLEAYFSTIILQYLVIALEESIYKSYVIFYSRIFPKIITANTVFPLKEKKE